MTKLWDINNETEMYNKSEVDLILSTLPTWWDMLKSENLSWLSNYATARTNLWLNTTANQTDSTNKRFMTDAQESKLDAISWTNTWDQDLSWYVLSSSLWTMSTENTTSYYTISQTDTLLSWKANTSHTHSTADITNLSSYTWFDTRYYTETETDALLWNKQNTLVSWTNIKTIFTRNILWSWNIVFDIWELEDWDNLIWRVWTKQVLETAIWDDKILVYKTASGNLEYEAKPTWWNQLNFLYPHNYVDWFQSVNASTNYTVPIWKVLYITHCVIMNNAYNSLEIWWLALSPNVFSITNDQYLTFSNPVIVSAWTIVSWSSVKIFWFLCNENSNITPIYSSNTSYTVPAWKKLIINNISSGTSGLLSISWTSFAEPNVLFWIPETNISMNTLQAPLILDAWKIFNSNNVTNVRMFWVLIPDTFIV